MYNGRWIFGDLWGWVCCWYKERKGRVRGLILRDSGGDGACGGCLMVGLDIIGSAEWVAFDESDESDRELHFI